MHTGHAHLQQPEADELGGVLELIIELQISAGEAARLEKVLSVLGGVTRRDARIEGRIVLRVAAHLIERGRDRAQGGGVAVDDAVCNVELLQMLQHHTEGHGRALGGIDDGAAARATEVILR